MLEDWAGNVLETTTQIYNSSDQNKVPFFTVKIFVNSKEKGKHFSTNY